MNITCRTCATLLRRSAANKPTTPDCLAVPWYRDEHGARHMALACLHCGTVHDCVGAQRPAIFTALMSPLKINMVKVVATLSPQETLQRSTSCPPQDTASVPEKPAVPDPVLDALRQHGLCPRG